MSMPDPSEWTPGAVSPPLAAVVVRSSCYHEENWIEGVFPSRHLAEAYMLALPNPTYPNQGWVAEHWEGTKLVASKERRLVPEHFELSEWASDPA